MKGNFQEKLLENFFMIKLSMMKILKMFCYKVLIYKEKTHIENMKIKLKTKTYIFLKIKLKEFMLLLDETCIHKINKKIEKSVFFF